MALNLNECVAAVNGGFMPGQLRLRPTRGFGMHGLAGNAAAMHAAWLQQDALKKKADASLQQARGLVQRSKTALSSFMVQVRQAEAGARSSSDPGAFGMTQQLADAQYSAQSAVEEAEAKLRDFEEQIAALRSRGPIGANVHNRAGDENGAEWKRAADRAYPEVKAAVDQVNRAIRDASPILGQVQAQQQQQQQSIALQLEQQRLAREAEDRRRADEAAARQREADALYQREQQRIEQQAAIRREEREYEDRLEQQRLAREAAVRAEAAAARSGEAQFQQALLQMEQQRADAELQFRREQAEREAEREARREEQEAFLQQLLLMQELGVQSPAALPPAFQAGAPQPGFPQPGFPAQPGFPQPGYPGFAPAYPQAAYGGPGFGPPQQPYYGPPAAPGAVSAYPGQTGAVPGRGFPPAPAYPAYSPPAFTQGPQPFQQALPTGIPQQQAPPGFQWASFNPANELFGMGAHCGSGGMRSAQGVRRLPFGGSAQAAGLGAADQPSSNPTLKGGKVELGYNVYGPSVDSNGKSFYTFEAPDGASWMVFAEQVTGPLATPQRDPRTNLIVYVPSQASSQEDEFDWQALQDNLRQFVGTGVQAYQQVALTRELEKAARQTRREARATGRVPRFNPDTIDLAFGERRPFVRRGMPSWILPVGIATVGLGIALAKKR